MTDDIKFEEMDWTGIDWRRIDTPIDPDEVEIPAHIDSIMTREEAVEAGKEILEKFWEKNSFTDYSLFAIAHSIKDNIWRFDYAEDDRDIDDNTMMPGGTLTVALEGTICEVIMAWVGE